MGWALCPALASAENEPLREFMHREENRSQQPSRSHQKDQFWEYDQMLDSLRVLTEDLGT